LGALAFNDVNHSKLFSDKKITFIKLISSEITLKGACQNKKLFHNNVVISQKIESGTF